MTTINPAETYESFMVPTLFGPWARCLADSARPRVGERVLDVGCGTGIVARIIAPLVGASGAVTGMDISPDMLAVARATSRQEGVAVSWQQGRAEEMPFPDGSFDLVVSQFALMFFSDQQAALREMRRVLADGGRVGVSVWQGLDQHPFYQKLDAAISRRLSMSGVGDIFSLGDADRLRRMLNDAGFTRVTVSPATITSRFPNPDGFLAGEIAVDTAAIPSMQNLDDQARQDIINAIRDDMEEPLREVTQDNHVVIPFHALIAHAQ